MATFASILAVVCLMLVIDRAASVASLSRTETPTDSETSDKTLTGTRSRPSKTSTVSPHDSKTLTISPSLTSSKSASPMAKSMTISGSQSKSQRTETASQSSGGTCSASWTGSSSETVSFSSTPTADGSTPTDSQSQTASYRGSMSESPTSAKTASNTSSLGSRSATLSDALTDSRTLINSPSGSLVETPTASLIPTPTSTSTDSFSETMSVDFTDSDSGTPTRSVTQFLTGTDSKTDVSLTDFRTFTLSETITTTGAGRSMTQSWSDSQSLTATFSGTVTTTHSATLTDEYTNWTFVPSETRTGTHPTLTFTPSEVPSESFTPSNSKTMSSSLTHTFSSDQTPTFTITFLPSSTMSSSATVTDSPSKSSSHSNSNDPSLSHSPTQSLTNYGSESPTQSDSHTFSSNDTITTSESVTRSLSTTFFTESSVLTGTNTGTEDDTLTQTVTVTQPPTRTQTSSVIYHYSLASSWEYALEWLNESANECMTPIMYVGTVFLVIFVLTVVVTLFLICVRFPVEVDTFQEVSFWRSLFVLHTYFSILWPCHYRCAYLHCFALLFHFNVLTLLMNGMLNAFAANTGLEVALIVILSCVCANATRPLVNVILFHHSFDPRDEPLRKVEVVRYIEDIEAAKAAGIPTFDPRKKGAKPRKDEKTAAAATLQSVKKAESSSSARGNLTSGGTTKASTIRGEFDFDIEFEDIEFEDFPQSPFKKPGTAQSFARNSFGSTSRLPAAANASISRLSAADAFDVMQSFVFDFSEDIPERPPPPPIVPVVIIDAIETHSFGEYTPIDIGLRDMDDDTNLQVHWIPVTVHGLLISVGFLLVTVLLAMGNFYLTASLRSVGKCTSEKGVISFGNLLTVVLILDIFVFQTGFLGAVWFFRAMTSDEDDAYWSELHPYSGEWRVFKTQALAAMPPLNLDG